MTDIWGLDKESSLVLTCHRHSLGPLSLTQMKDRGHWQTICSRGYGPGWASSLGSVVSVWYRMPRHRWAALVSLSGDRGWSWFLRVLGHQSPSDLHTPPPPQFPPSSQLSNTSELPWSPEQNVGHLPLPRACQSMGWV